MEAANMGAYLKNHRREELNEALDIIAVGKDLLFIRSAIRDTHHAPRQRSLA